MLHFWFFMYIYIYAKVSVLFWIKIIGPKYTWIRVWMPPTSSLPCNDWEGSWRVERFFFRRAKKITSELSNVFYFITYLENRKTHQRSDHILYMYIIFLVLHNFCLQFDSATNWTLLNLLDRWWILLLKN